MDRTLRGAQAYIRRTAGVHQSHSKSVLLSAFKTLCLSFSGENGVAMTKPISASFSGAIGVIETCGRRIGSEPRKRVVRKGTSRFQFVPVCGKREQTGTLMGAGPGALPSAFICAICGSFPAGRAGGGPGAFKVQRFKVQAFKGTLSSRLPCMRKSKLNCVPSEEIIIADSSPLIGLAAHGHGGPARTGEARGDDSQTQAGA